MSKSYVGQDAADLGSDAQANSRQQPGVAPPDKPMVLTGKDGKPLPAAEQPPGGHVADATSPTNTGSAG